MAIPTHLEEGDYSKNFPPAIDEFPTIINEQYYIDAWLLNSPFDSLLAIEQYLIDHRASIEASLGSDVLGIQGNLLIAIPPGLYLGYLFAMAWDPNLIEENILAGITIFGVTGSLEAGAEGLSLALPALDASASWLFPAIPGLVLAALTPTLSAPTVTAA